RARRGQERHVRPGAHGEPDCSAPAAGRCLSRRVHRLADRGPRERRFSHARRAFPRLSLHRSVRIAYDVTPLSHPRTGVGNYILGALKGMVEAADGSHELVAFGPVSIRGRKLLDLTLADLPVGRRLATVPFAHAVRTVWSRLGRPPAERFLGQTDVLHFTDWMVPPGRPRVRATMIHDLGPLRYPERLHPRTVRMHTATARAAAGCDVVFTNAEFTAADVV